MMVSVGQPLGAADIVIGERVAEVIRAVADRCDHLAFGRREFRLVEPAAEPEAEAAGEAHPDSAGVVRSNPLTGIPTH